MTAPVPLTPDDVERHWADIDEGIAPGQQERWLVENQDALESSNAFIDRYGLPLTQYRNF